MNDDFSLLSHDNLPPWPEWDSPPQYQLIDCAIAHTDELLDTGIGPDPSEALWGG